MDPWQLAVTFTLLAHMIQGGVQAVDNFLTPEELYSMPWSTPLSNAVNYSVIEGDPLELECDHAVPGDTILWYVEHVNATTKATDKWVAAMNTDVGAKDRHRFTLTHFSGGLVLRATAATLAEEGAYSCQVFGGAVIKTFFVLVNIPPTVKPVPESGYIDVMMGESVTIGCQATGKPRPEITWAKTGSRFSDGHETHYGEDVTFPQASKDVTGEYVCVASNGVGQPAVGYIDVTVLYSPVVKVHTPVVYAGTSNTSPVTLACSFDASPPVEVIWRQNSSQISFRDRKYLSESQVDGRHELTIEWVAPRDFGIYECVGGNTVGQDIGTISLKVEPHSLMIESDTAAPYSDQYTLEWSVQSHEQLVEFDLQMQQVNDTANSSWVSNVIPAVRHHSRPHHQQAFVLRELTPSATYRVKLRARNVYGYSDWTDEFEFYTNTEGKIAPTGGPSTHKALPTPSVFTEMEGEADTGISQPHEGGSTDSVSMVTSSVCLVAVTFLASLL